MAHGAPDHTRLSESGFAHYVDRVVIRNSAPLCVNPLWEETVNEDIQGVFGYMWGWCDTFAFNVRITIDGQIIFIMTIHQMAGGGFWGSSGAWDKFGCTRYSAVAGDLNYGMFYDEKWGLYIHHNLTIEVQQSAALGNLASWGIYYKELI